MVRRLGAGGNPAAFLGGPAVVTGPDGGFTLKNLTPAHNLELEATRSGYAPARPAGVVAKPTAKPADQIADPFQPTLPQICKANLQDSLVAGRTCRFAIREAARPVGRTSFRQAQRRLSRPYVCVRPATIASALTKTCYGRTASI